MIWQLLSHIIGQEILIASPISVIKEMLVLLQDFSVYYAIFNSVIKILFGFIMAALLGAILALISHKSYIFKKFIDPIIIIFRAIPVVSFIILLLIWISSKNISIAIAFLIVLPVIYTNTLEGIENVDTKILEMATVFKVNKFTKLKYIYLPSVLPFFKAACHIAIGLAFKAGIAAEIIGLPNNTIGDNLYNAKIYFDTPALFAWTIIIVITAFTLEKLFKFFLNSVVINYRGFKL